jgi:Prokaryotic E2 family E
MKTEHHHYHIYINHDEHTVHEEELLGIEIKALAGIAKDHVLCLDAAIKNGHEDSCKPHHSMELQVISDCKRVNIKNGLHFYTHAANNHSVTVTINREEYTFEQAKQTGHSIKERAGIALTDVLFLHETKEDQVITDDECITLKCGDCFHSAPPADYGYINPASQSDFECGQVLPQPDGWKFVIFDNYTLPDGFSEKSIRLLIKLAPSFPDAAPDMFWVSPELRTSSNVVPQGTSLEIILNEQWQRFSWHLQAGAWKPGLSTLRDFLRSVRARFEKRN